MTVSTDSTSVIRHVTVGQMKAVLADLPDDACLHTPNLVGNIIVVAPDGQSDLGYLSMQAFWGPRQAWEPLPEPSVEFRSFVGPDDG